jgi:hypothetical protein
MSSFRTLSGWIRGFALLAATLLPGLVGDSWTGAAFGQSIGLSAITTFGSNGYLSTTANQFMDSTGRFNRGLAYNPVTQNLVLVSRTNTSITSGNSNNIVILNGTTGVVTGTLNPSGITGATFPINMAGVGDDGRIYVANLQAGATGTSTTNLFKVYQWENETTLNAPSLAFQVAVPFSQSGTNTNFVTGWRFGDSFAVRGSGTSTKFVVAGGSSGSSSGFINNSNFMLGNLDGSNFNTIYRTISATNSTSLTNNGYRLGITWVDDDTIIGLAGGPALLTDFVTTGSGQTTSNATVAAGIVTGTNTSFGGNTNLRVIDYISMGGKQYAASVVAAFGNQNRVEVYDISSGTSAVLVSSLNLATEANTNSDGTGSIAFARNQVTLQDGFYSVPLYVLNTNNGIQAMVFSVPEPSAWAMLATGAGLSGLAGYRRRNRRRS